MNAVLARAGVDADDVDAVFVTGGSAQVPAVRALFVETRSARSGSARRSISRPSHAASASPRRVPTAR